MTISWHTDSCTQIHQESWLDLIAHAIFTQYTKDMKIQSCKQEIQFVNYKNFEKVLHQKWCTCWIDIIMLKEIICTNIVLIWFPWNSSALRCPMTYLRCLPLRASITTLWKAILKSSLGGLKVLDLIYRQSTGAGGNMLPIITEAGHAWSFVSPVKKVLAYSLLGVQQNSDSGGQCWSNVEE